MALADPLVSVIIPTANRPQFLLRVVESALWIMVFDAYRPQRDIICLCQSDTLFSALNEKYAV